MRDGFYIIHVVFFGKASSCENPVLMKVNERDDFIARFRTKHPTANNPPAACIPDAIDESRIDENGEEDNIPF